MAKRSSEFGTFVRPVGRLLGVTLFILSTGTMCGVGRAQAGRSRADLIKLSRESCVAVCAKPQSQWVRMGSGFFIDPNLVVTCCHVVNRGVLPIDPKTKTFDPNKWQPWPDVSIGTMKGEIIPVECNSVPTAAEPSPGTCDFVVLKLKAKSKGRYPVLRLCQNTASLTVGDDVYFSGFPLGAPAMLTHKGMLSGLAQNPDRLCIQAPINKGNSGGAVLNMQGEVIGIINSKEGGITSELDRVRTVIVGMEQNKTSVTFAGPAGEFSLLKVNKDTIDILDRYISTGIGYAINTTYIRDYVQKHNLIKPAAATK